MASTAERLREAGVDSRNVSNLAAKIDSLDPLVRDRYEQTVVDFYQQYGAQGYDIDINQAARTTAEQRAIQGTGVQAASPRNTWHTVGGAADFTIYKNGVRDTGTTYKNAYTTLLAPIASQYGLANPFPNDVGHFQAQEFPLSRGGRDIMAFIAAGAPQPTQMANVPLPNLSPLNAGTQLAFTTPTVPAPGVSPQAEVIQAATATIPPPEVPAGPYGVESVYDAALTGDPNTLKTVFDGIVDRVFSEVGLFGLGKAQEAITGWFKQIVQAVPDALRAVQEKFTTNPALWDAVPAPMQPMLRDAFSGLPLAPPVQQASAQTAQPQQAIPNADLIGRLMTSPVGQGYYGSSPQPYETQVPAVRAALERQSAPMPWGGYADDAPAIPSAALLGGLFSSPTGQGYYDTRQTDIARGGNSPLATGGVESYQPTDDYVEPSYVATGPASLGGALAYRSPQPAANAFSQPAMSPEQAFGLSSSPVPYTPPTPPPAPAAPPTVAPPKQIVPAAGLNLSQPLTGANQTSGMILADILAGRGTNPFVIPPAIAPLAVPPPRPTQQQLPALTDRGFVPTLTVAPPQPSYSAQPGRLASDVISQPGRAGTIVQNDNGTYTELANFNSTQGGSTFDLTYGGTNAQGHPTTVYQTSSGMTGTIDQVTGTTTYDKAALCSYYMRKRWLSKTEWKADTHYSLTLPLEMRRGYQTWARPLVDWMERGTKAGRIVERILWPVVRAWSKEMASRGDPEQFPQGSIAGRVVMATFGVACLAIGHLMTAGKTRLAFGK